jgi:PiT family inorganic phosphate transporter
VANTIGRGIVSPEAISDQVIFGALMGAIFWQVITGYLGIPSSSSHALIGGLVGAGISHVGPGAIVWSGLGKTAAAIVVSPFTGMAIALLLMLVVLWSFRRAPSARVDGLFRKIQFVSASLYSLGHGGNDAQKTMGIIAALLYAHGKLSGGFHVPLWVVVSCNGAMALGTLFGGWRIVRTMGSRITRLAPVQAVCAETAGSITLFLATGLGIPVSTTHTITGAIVGVGAAGVGSPLERRARDCYRLGLHNACRGSPGGCLLLWVEADLVIRRRRSSVL